MSQYGWQLAREEARPGSSTVLSEHTGIQSDMFQTYGPQQQHLQLSAESGPSSSAGGGTKHTHPHCAPELQFLPPDDIYFSDFRGFGGYGPFDPRLFDVGMQYAPPVAGAVQTHSVGFQSDGQQQQAPLVSGISSFEPMMTTYGTNQAFPAAQETSVSSDQSSSDHSPASFSRKDSADFINLSPASPSMFVEPTRPGARLDPVPSSGPRRKSISIAPKVSGHQASVRKPSLSSSSAGRAKRNNRTTTITTTAVSPDLPLSAEIHTPSPKTSVFVAVGSESPGAPEQSQDKKAKRSTTTCSSSGGSLSPEKGQQQQQYHPQEEKASQRLRNRVAATKCRAKSRLAVAALEATERAVNSQHTELSATARGLREEVLALKNEVLAHGNCECPHIQQYLANAARNIGQQTVLADGGSRSPSTSSSSRPAAQYEVVEGGRDPP